MSYFKSLKQLFERFVRKDITTAIVRADLRAIKKLAPEKLNSTDNIGNTPLHLAVLSNNIEVVKTLLSLQPDLETKNRFGQTALMLVCEISSTKNPYYQIFVTPKDDNSIRKQNCFEIVQLLVQAGANIHTQDKNDTTPIIKATLKENELIVQYLLESCDIYQKDKKNGTVTAYALECDNPTLIKMIIESMNSEKFTDFISYVKTLRSIIKHNTIEELTLIKEKMDSEKRKHNLESMLGVKAGRTRQVKI